MKQKITITKYKCNINLKIDYFLHPLATIRGLKKLDENITMYLIEFINYNRIWTIYTELDI